MNTIILSGGKGSRLGGKEKAFLKTANQTFIEKEIKLLQSLFNRIIVVTNTPSLYKTLKVDIVEDRKKGLGPLMGLYSGLKASKSKYNFITTSDAPLLKKELVVYLKENCTGSDVFVPKWNKRLQPLCAIYSKRCVKFIEKALSGKGSIRSFYKYTNVRFVPEKTIKKLDPEGKSFFNVNTTSDYKRLNNYI